MGYVFPLNISLITGLQGANIMNSAVNFSCAITREVVIGYVLPLNSLITDLPSIGNGHYKIQL